MQENVTVQDPKEGLGIYPHQGVLNPIKGNIRVIVDWSSQYKGTSINQNLLPGPYLTNQLIGVYQGSGWKIHG